MLPESNTVIRNGFEVLAEYRIFEPMADIKVNPEKKESRPLIRSPSCILMALFSPFAKWSCSLGHVVSVLQLDGTPIAESEVTTSNQ